MQSVLNKAESLYHEYRYQDAYKLTQHLWGKRSTLSCIDRPYTLVVASRLADVLGARKLAQSLALRAARRYPEDGWVQFYYDRHIHGFKNHYDLLRHYENHPLVPSGDGKLDGFLHAQRCVNWAFVRDFNRAYDHLERAFECDCPPAWLHHQRARALLYEDRPEDALADAERAFELRPQAIYAVGILSDVLARLKRYEEAAERSWSMVENDQVHSYRYVQTVMRNQGALVDRAGSGHEAARRMLHLCDELERTAPLADEQTSRSIRLSQIDAHLMNDDLDRAAELAEGTEHAFYGKVFRYYRDRKSSARQVVLPHTPVLQDRLHCLPASVSVVLSRFGDSMTQHQIAQELTMGGTSIGELTVWLRERGYQVIHFLANQESSRAVLEAGIPFVYHETYEASAHSMAMVGYDERLGIFLIHDPGYSRLSQMVASSIGSGEAPLGAHGTMVLPAEQSPPELSRELTEPVEAYYDYFRLFSDSGWDAAERRVAELEREFPEHAITRYLRAEQHHRRGQHGDAQEILMALYREHPRCVYFRRMLLRVLRAQENSALMRDVLHEIVRKGTVRGIRPDKKFRLPMATYKCQYADYIRMSADGLDEAYRYIGMALQQEPSNGEPYHILGDTLNEENRGREAILAYRVASCLEPHNSHYAHACFSLMMRFEGRDVALERMRVRAEQLGRHPRGMDAWDDYVRALDEAGWSDRALEEMKALLEVHGENPVAQSYAARLFARKGEWESAWEAVNRLKSGANEALYLPAVTDLFWYQRELEPGLQLAQRWVELEPGNGDARRSVLLFTRHLHDNYEAFRIAEQWFHETPDNETIENIYLSWLRRLAKEKQKIEVLRRRITRNPKDAWAWRELGFDYAAEMLGATGEVFDAGRAGLLECIEQCQELSPGWADCALKAELAEAEGRGHDALTLWLEALKFSPDYDHAMKRAWDLSSGLGGDVKANVLVQLREHMLARTEVDDTHFVYSVADRYGFEEAARLLTTLREQHPHEPQLAACRAWLIMNYSMGAADLGSLDDALEALQLVQSEHPGHRGIILAIAGIHRRENRHDQGIELLHQWIEYNRTDMDAVRRLAWFCEEAGRMPDALAALEQAVERCPGSEESYQMLAEFLGHDENPEQAIEVYRKGLEKLPENIWLREQYVDFCLQFGLDEMAVAVAREGVGIYPDGAYLWYQYGRALFRAEWMDDTTDPVEPLKKSLTLNAELYNAADLLAVIYTGRARYDEALAVMAPFVDSAENRIYARARCVTVKRLRAEGKGDAEDKRATVDEALAVVDEAPDYEWMWSRLLNWLEADKDWERAKDVFAELPPVMLSSPDFRSRRLELLQDAGVNDLDADWDRLLSDFPRNAILHNSRFDILWKKKRYVEASDLLTDLCRRNEQTLWVDIRLVQAYVHLGPAERAVEAARKVWLSPVELSVLDDNPASFSWRCIFKADAPIRKAVVLDYISLLGGAEPVRPLSIRRFCERMEKADRPLLCAVVHALVKELKLPPMERLQWWLRRDFSESIHILHGMHRLLLELLLQSNWANEMHYCCLLMAGDTSKWNARLADRLRKQRAGIETQSTYAWGSFGYVYFDHNRKWILDHMVNWREQPGVKSWHILNYLIVHLLEHPRDAALRLRDSLALLENFKHDSNFYAVAWLAVDSAVRAGEYEQLSAIYRQYGVYLNRPKEEGEFLADAFAYAPKLMPLFIELAEKGWSKGLQARFRQDVATRKKIGWARKCWKDMRAQLAGKKGR